MPDRNKLHLPDPLEPGHIDGQNPMTPERMPGHTAAYGEDAPAAEPPRDKRGESKPARAPQRRRS